MPTLDEINAPWTLERCKGAYETYLDSKTAEIEEQRQARRYYHGAQLTDGQRKAIKERGLAPVIFNRIGPKIDEFGGTLERLKQDAKAYPRTEQHRQGADLVTETLRFELDEEGFDTLAPNVAKHGAIDGIGVLEMILEDTGRGAGDFDVSMEEVDPADYFYDPRTCKLDFSDCKYDGVGRWFALEDAIDLYPDKAEPLAAERGADSDLTSDPDKDRKWFQFSNSGNSIEKVRICEVWYKHKGGYRWAIFTGSDILYEGEGYFFGPRGKQISKYISFAANRDQDGDAYGFIRSMKYAQDEINAWKMGLNFDIQSRRIVVTGDIPQNIEQVRKEMAKKDGVVVFENPNANVTIADKMLEINGAINAIADAKGEIDRYGFDSGILGENPDLSGRAIERLNAAGLARLGPYLTQYREWKIRVYRALWAQIQRYWTAERWVRVTDDEGIAQFVQLNALGFDETGVPIIQNAIGEMDVDIIIDEGPDTINAMQQISDDLSMLISKGVEVPPEVVIELADVDAKTKKKINKIIEDRRQAAATPDPIAQAAAQTEIRIGEATAADLESRAAKNMAEIEDKRSTLSQAEQFAGIQKTQADAAKAEAAAREAGGPGSSVLDDAEQIARIRKLAAEAGRVSQPQPAAY